MSGTDVGLDPRRQEPQQTTHGLLDDAARQRVQALFDRLDRAENQAFSLSMSQALRADPDLAGEAQRLASETGVDALTIEKNIDTFRRAARESAVERLRLAKGDTGLARMLLDPSFSRVAHDDLENLGFLEEISRAWTRGRFTSDLGKLGAKLRDRGPLSREEMERADWIANYLETTRTPANIFYDATEILGQLNQIVPRILEVGLASGLAAGGTALAAGPASPVAAPAAGISGFLVGAGAAAFEQTYQIEGGHIYLDLINTPGVDEASARWASRIGGALAATAEVAGGALVTRGAGLLARPAGRALRQVIGRETAQALTRPTIGQAGVEFAKGYMLGLAGEVGTEAAQEIIAFTSESAARMLSGLPPEEGLGERLGEIIGKTARGMALLALPGPGATFVADASRVRRVEEDAQAFEEWAQRAAKSKVKARNPGAFEAFADRTMKGQRGETVYVNAEQFVEVLAQAGMTRDELAQALPDVAEQLPKALASGGDVVIPTGRYGAKVIGTDLDGVLRQHVRFDPDGYSQAEVSQIKGALKEQAFEAGEATEAVVTFNQQASRIEQNLRQQIKATGRRVTPDQARDTAATYRAFIERQSLRLRITPEEFVARFPLQVVRGEVVSSQGLQQLAAREQELAERMRQRDQGELQTLRTEFARRQDAGEVIPLDDPMRTRLTELEETGIETPTFARPVAGQELALFRGVPQDPTSVVPFFSGSPLIAGQYAQQRGTGEVQEIAITPTKIFDARQPVPEETLKALAERGAEPGAINALRGIKQPGQPAALKGLIDSSPKLFDALRAEGFDLAAFNDTSQVRDTSFVPLTDVQPTRTFQARDELAQMVSSRVPTGLKATENPNLEVLTTDISTALADKETLAKNAKTIRDLPFLRVEEGLNDEQTVEVYIQHVVDNLNWLFDQMPEELRERSAGWYDGGRRFAETWAERYGVSEQQAAAVIAILSPQRDWFVNMTMAERILDIWSGQDAWTDEMTTRARKRKEKISPPAGVRLKDVLGKRLSELDGLAAAYWVRLFDQAHNDPTLAALTPEGNNAGTFGSRIQWTKYPTIAKALSVLRDGSRENISQQLGQQHKVRSFYNNLFDPNAPQQDVTIDTHAVAAAYVLPLASESRFVTQAWGGQGGATSRATGLLGFYPLLAEAYRRVGAERGLLARQVQSITWEQGRALFTPTRKRNTRLLQEADAIWARYKAGDIEADEARDLMVETFGGFEPLTWDGVEATDELTETYQGKSRTEVQPKEEAADTAPRVMVEAKPNTNPELLARWEQLDEEQRASATTEILSKVVSRVAEEFGTEVTLQSVRGGWRGDPEAAVAVTFARSENSVAAAAVLGDLLHQEAMFVLSTTRAQGLNKGKGLLITLPEGYTVEQIDKLYTEVLWPIEANGKRPFVGHSTQGRHMVIGIDEKKFGPVRALAALVAERLDDTFTIATNDVFSRTLERGEDYGQATASQQPSTRRSPAETRSDRLLRETAAIYRDALDRVQGRRTLRQQERGIERRAGGLDEGARRQNAAWNARAGLPVGPSGRTTLRHWSRAPRAELDPAFHGTGIRGEERKRKGDAEWVDRTYYGVEGYSKETGLGRYLHEVDIDPGDLYDASGNPLGVIKPGMTPSQAEAAIKEAGFVGYFTSQAPIVAVFDRAAPARVTDEVTGETTEFAQEETEGEARAAFNPDTGTISLFEKADVTSVLHEMAHAFLHWYGQLAGEDAQIGADMRTFLDWRGIEGGIDAWNAMTLDEQRPHHEAFAEAFEVYAFDGVAPSIALQGVFGRFRGWIVKLWRNLSGEVQELSPEIRGVFDRMLASEDEVAHAESVRGLSPLFEEQPEGMSDEEWVQMQRLSDQAFEAIVAEVQKRSLRDMQWLSRARGKKLRELQRKHDKTRKRIRAEVREEVRLLPVYRALSFIRHGKWIFEDGEVVDFEGTHKLHTASVKEFLPEDANLRALRITHPEGMAPDQAAEMLGFTTGEELVRALADARPQEEVVDERVDQRMAAEHADLTDAAAVQRAVDEALHNPARAKFVASELKALTRATQPVRVLVAAAREVARDILSSTPVAQIKPWRYQAAEARANRAALRAAAKGDTEAAILAKRAELLQHELAREAAKVERAVARAQVRFRKFFRPDEKLGRTRNVDVIAIGRGVLAAHGFESARRSPAAYLEDVRQYAPELAEELAELVARTTEDQTPLRELPLGEFEVLADALNALWHRSLRERQVLVDGKLVERDLIVTQLIDVLKPPDRPRPSRALSSKEERRLSFGSLLASVRHVESWALQRDGGTTGDVHRYLFALLREPFDDYLQEKQQLVKPLSELVRRLKVDRKQKIYAKEIDYEFADKLELLGALLHSGNESNVRKLLLGRDWVAQPQKRGGPIDESAWWKFLARAMEEGPNGEPPILTQEDFEFAQAVWDTFEGLFPRAQEVHFDLYGYRADNLKSRAIETPWGTFRGGYYPATVDQRDAARRGKGIPQAPPDADPVTQVMSEIIGQSRDHRGAMPSTGRGFMVSRVEVNRPLVLDIRLATTALDEHLRFIHLQRPGRDLLRLLRDERLADAIGAVDPSAISHMFMPWLGDTLRNKVMKTSGHPVVDKFLAGLRRNVGLGIMFANARVALQQITGLGTSKAYMPLKFLRSGLSVTLQHPKQTYERVISASKFMRSRLEDAVGQITDDVDLLTGPAWLRGGQDWTRKHGFFLQRLFQVPVDVVTWVGAHDHAVSQGRTPEEAVRHADAIVRRSQSSGLAPDISRYERSTALVRLFTQFASFWMATMNTLVEKPSVERFGLVIGIVGLGGAAIAKVLEGGWEDDDEDGEMWDDVTAWLFSESLQTAASALLPPPLSQITRPITGEFGGRIELGAAISQANRAVRAVMLPIELLVDEDREVKGHDVRAIGTLLTLLTGLPITALTRPIGFEVDVQRGDTETSGPVDRARGLIVGR